MIPVEIYFTIFSGYSNSPGYQPPLFLKERVHLAAIPSKGDWVSFGMEFDSKVESVQYFTGGKVALDLGKLYAGNFIDNNSEPTPEEVLELVRGYIKDSLNG